MILRTNTTVNKTLHNLNRKYKCKSKNISNQSNLGNPRQLMMIKYHSIDNQGRQENFWAPVQKETWPPSSNSPNNDTQTKSTTVCHKQGMSTTKMN
jgi:hypothetical protein